MVRSNARYQPAFITIWNPWASALGKTQQIDDGSIGLRAARYVRMSTDHQKYSTQNQSDAIAAYSVLHNLTIVRTYSRFLI
jgi:Resolvase, N terminal domain